jgi:hypothetical protein
MESNRKRGRGSPWTVAAAEEEIAYSCYWYCGRLHNGKRFDDRFVC